MGHTLCPALLTVWHCTSSANASALHSRAELNKVTQNKVSIHHNVSCVVAADESTARAAV